MNPGNGTAESPFPSASVLILRDAPGGLEVFLLKRHGLSEVLGGAYVFPGGKVDLDDALLADRLDQASSALREALGEYELDESCAAGLYVAAIREAYEEAGVLFAAVGQDRVNETQVLHRAAAGSFRAATEGLGTPLAATSLLPWSRWVTPRNSVRARKHFDARFFVAAAPLGQKPVHDRHETTESVWLAPSAALREFWEGRIELAPPQIMTLAQIARFSTVEDVLAHARSHKPPRIQPEAFQEAGVNMVCYPGDPRHSVPDRLLPGPTRLCWRNDRYEPEGGLESLLA
ncbi:NUDIX hydrolase [Variovorax sp. Sphag1AA]|uniref:NUDIX hydrolase n=1 Tax=Variovorax sp. Sphag1AA TaxID=2587027 RepID=UPI00161609BD|nr:NUDIX hydrolase [Variovorax sp. Sphag1AA]MBB3181112.1 8-oxo-dGTP pyrophosphatase MutT (NUDIX family) [Variovorax sp. Sphag1AA]